METEVISEEIEIHGYCEPRFETVKEAFANNFRYGGDVGASFGSGSPPCWRRRSPGGNPARRAVTMR